jgi:hypothetical protein
MKEEEVKKRDEREEKGENDKRQREIFMPPPYLYFSESHYSTEIYFFLMT